MKAADLSIYLSTCLHKTCTQHIAITYIQSNIYEALVVYHPMWEYMYRSEVGVISHIRNNVLCADAFLFKRRYVVLDRAVTEFFYMYFLVKKELFKKLFLSKENLFLL